MAPTGPRHPRRKPSPVPREPATQKPSDATALSRRFRSESRDPVTGPAGMAVWLHGLMASLSFSPSQ